MALIPDNPIVPTPTVTVTQTGNTVSPVDVSFSINDPELLYQAKEVCRQDTHAFISAYLADTAEFTGGPLDKLFNAIAVAIASDTVTS